MYSLLKKIFRCISPAYRTALRIEEYQRELEQHLEQYSRKQEMLFWLQMRLPGENLKDTQKRVFMDIPKASGILREIQLGNLYVLKKLRDICDVNNMSYALHCGTLLGAVRHKGFIPWDDDIDVAMPRHDVERLKRIVEHDQCFEIKSYYQSDFRMYIHKMVFRNSDYPFWVDIFPYDYADSTINGTEATIDKINMVRENVEVQKEKIKGKLKKRYNNEVIEDKRDLQLLNDIFFEGKKALSVLHGKPDCIYRGIDTVYTGGENLWFLNDILPLKKVEFEGEEYTAFKCAEDYYLQGDFLWFPKNVTPGHIEFYESKAMKLPQYLKELGIQINEREL